MTFNPFFCKIGIHEFFTSWRKTVEVVNGKITECRKCPYVWYS